MMSDNFFQETLRAPRSARSGRRVALCANSLLRYAILGAVALSILPASALANIQLPTAQAQDQSGDKAELPVKLAPKVCTLRFRELLFKASQLRDEGALDLSATFAFNIEADRNDDATLELKTVYNNMTVSANGKQLALKLEMSREAAGNLLFRQITPN